MSNRLPVKDMPEELMHACRDRGYDKTHEMTFAEALREWAAFNIGDASWADDMLNLQSEFVTDLREQT